MNTATFSASHHCYQVFKLTAIAAALVTGVIPNVVMADTTQHFNIPAQPLDNALTELADNANLKLLYPVDIVKNQQSKPLSGNYSPQQALQKMLAGTGITAKSTSNGAVMLAKADTTETGTKTETKPKTKTEKKASGDVTLPTITVSDNNFKDPYNQDYLLPNATSGTKTDTPIMETPLNVQVISKQVLKDQQVINLGDALKNVSGVTVLSNGGSEGFGKQQFVLRGFASQTYFRNGFRLQNGSSSRNMSNVESVEVVKGPAAILYGLVEPGGMVNVVTKQPLATPYYSLNQQFGSFSNYRTTIDATGPLTKDDTLLYRLNASYQNSGSFQELVHTEDFFIAPVLKWNISPRTQATFEFEYNRQNLVTTQGYRPIINGQVVDLSRKLNYNEAAPTAVETFYGGFNWSHAFNDDWQIKHYLSINQTSNRQFTAQAESATDTTLTRAHLFQKTQSNTYATGVDLTGHFKTFGLEHTLLFGGDYYRTDRKQYSSGIPDPDGAGLAFGGLFYGTTIDLFNPVHTGFSTAGFQQALSSPQITDQYGAYIQDQIKLPYDVHVMGGIRYQNLHQSVANHYSGAFEGLVPDDSSATHSDAVTPRVGILWQPQKWLSLYANYVESFGANTGQIWVSDTQFKMAPPTSATQYEGGIKTEFFNGRLRANLAYFDIVKTNVATSDPVHLGFSRVTGAVQSRGYELDVTGEILPGWNAIATYSNTDAKVLKSSEVDSISNASGLGVAGSRYFGVPRNTASLWNTYEFQQGNLLGLKFGGGVTVRSGQVACCSDPAYTIPGYATVDLLTAYSHKVGKSKVTVQLNVNNLLDKHYYTGMNYASSINGALIDFSTPRTFMGSIGIQF